MLKHVLQGPAQLQHSSSTASAQCQHTASTAPAPHRTQGKSEMTYFLCLQANALRKPFRSSFGSETCTPAHSHTVPRTPHTLPLPKPHPTPRTASPCPELFIALSLNWLHCVPAYDRPADVGVPLAPRQPCKTESSSFGRPARAGPTERRQTLCSMLNEAVLS